MCNCPEREAEPAFRTGDRSGKAYRSNGSWQKKEMWVKLKVPSDALPWSLMTLPICSQWKREASVQDRGGCILHRGPYLLPKQWNVVKQTVAWCLELSIGESHGVP